MADSPLLSFSSYGSFSNYGSRPASRAHSHASDATERPDTANSTRNLTREVDHIKHLIKRSQNVSTQPQSITAQIFRQRSNSTPITLDHICHELDQLKKRIKEEQQPSPLPRALRASEVDPDASESEAEVDDVPDGREEELERARDEINVVKHNAESLLEIAESRVDRLTGEKEKLEGSLTDYKTRLSSQQGSLQDSQAQLKKLRGDNDNVTRSHNDAQQQILKLQDLRTQADTSLKLSSARVSQLEEENRKVAEQIKRLGTQHETRQKELNNEIQTLNGRNNDISAEAEELRTGRRVLQEKLEKAEAQSARSQREHDAQCTTLAGQIDEHKQLLQETREVADARAKEIGSLQNDRDKGQAHSKELERQVEEYKAKLKAAVEEQERLAETHRQNIEASTREYEQARLEAQADHEAKLKAVQQMLDGTRSSHMRELENAKISKAKEVDAMKAQWRTSLEKLKASHQSELEASKISFANELQKLKTAHEAQLNDAMVTNNEDSEALKAQLAEVTAQVNASQESHTAELEALRSESERRMKDAADELNSVKQEAQTEKSQADKNLAELKELLRDQTENAEASLAKIAESEKSHRVRLTELDADLAQTKAHLDTTRDDAEQLRSSTEALQSQITSKEKVLKVLRSDRDNLRQQKDEEINALQHKTTTMSSELASTKDSLEAARKAHTSALKQVKQDHAAEMEKLKSAQVAEVERIRLEYKEASESSGKKHVQEIAELTKTHQEALEQAGLGNDRALQQLQDQHAHDTVRFNDELAKTVSDMKQSHESALATVKSEDNLREQKVQEELAKSKADLATQVELTKKAAESSEAELAQVQGTYDMAMNNLRVEHLKETESLQTQHDAAHARLQSQHELDLGQTRKDLQTKIEEAAAAASKARDTSALRDQHSLALQQLTSTHEAERENLEAQHRAAIAGSRKQIEEAILQVDDLKAQHAKQLEDHASAHAKELGAVRSLLDQQGSEHYTRAAHAEGRLASLRADHAAELSRQSQEHEKMLAELRDANSKAASEQQAALISSEEEQSKAMVTATEAHRAELESHQKDRDATISDLKADHERAVSELQKSHDAVRQQMTLNHGTELQQMRSSAASELERVRREHSDALEGHQIVDEAKDADIAAMKQDHEWALEALKQQLEGDLRSSKALHQTHTTELRSALDAQLEEMRASHAQAFAAQESAWTIKLTALKEEHGKSLNSLVLASEDSTATKLQQLQTKHEEAILGASVEAKERARLAEQQHRAALESAVDRARHSGQAEVKNLKKRHQDAVAQIRKTAQQQSAAQLTVLEQSHQREHQEALLQARMEAERDLQTTLENHQGELLRLNTEHQTTLHALQASLDTKRVSEMKTKEDSHRHEVEALQARLDATLTGQAEAERSVARLRQQVSQAEQRVAEAKMLSEDDLTALQQEKTDLTAQLRQVQDSLRELQSKFSNGTTTPKSRHTNEELATIRLQLAALEEDRAMLRLTLQKRLDEKDDLIRQNDFLVQELETLHAQRLRPQNTARNMRDVQIQTEDFASEEPKVDLATFQNIRAGRRKSARPVTPMSPGQRQARDEIDMAWKTRSFEDYLHNAKTELSELGSAITANETLFAQKIQEHVGELQRVKDELAADYKSKLDDLATDKQRMEQMVTSKQTAAFAKDRQQLVVRYGADRDDTSDYVALRTAEERLVQDYNKRIAKRKSQIALRHAEEYHALTEEYDKKVAQLLDNQSTLEGDLSVDPWKFERDLGDLRKEGVKLEADKGRSTSESPVAVRSQRGRAAKRFASPQNGTSHDPTEQDASDRPKTARDSRRRPNLERWTSHPRNSTSIPRSSSVPRGSYQGRRESPEPPAVPKVLFPGGRDSPHSTSQPYQGRSGPPGTSKYPPVAERSLLRSKTPTDVQERRLVFTEPTPSPIKTPTKRGPEKAAQTLGITPTEVERQAMRQECGPNSMESPTRPGFLRRVRDRMSIDGHRPRFHRPGSRSGLATTPEPDVVKKEVPPAAPTGPSSSYIRSRRSRSTKLSSGMIYYQPPNKQGGSS
ncbi:hypothetical protein CLAFUW4_06329 [Fulvia fulva]|nr:hypothetical protein CLAFUR4_06332 [Fulvia fulva]WPV14863.1 hypothetical protein CLAFUW4_06329 [Fulvia fulva]